jgi:hypothetical protein
VRHGNVTLPTRFAGSLAPSRATVILVTSPVRPTRLGLRIGWARVGLATWAGVTIGMIAIAVTSRTVSKPPWWLGASTNPAPLYFTAIPVIVCLTPIIVIALRRRTSPLIGCVCSLALAVSALLDVSNTPGVAVVQAALAVAALSGSVALWAGIGTV